MEKETRSRWLRSGSIGLALLTAAGLWASPAQAGQASASFVVRVELQPAAARSGLCTQSQGGLPGGALITVACSTGAIFDIEAPVEALLRPSLPMHGGAFRYQLQAKTSTQGLTTVDGRAGQGGTVTGWQLVKTARQEYLELLLGW